MTPRVLYPKQSLDSEAKTESDVRVKVFDKNDIFKKEQILCTLKRYLLYELCKVNIT